MAQIEPIGAAHKRVFYRPAIVNTFGATAASAVLLRLSPAEVLDAFSLALCQNSCSGEILNSPDSHIRGIRDGMTAQAGVNSALLAKRGVKGFAQPIEGASGYYAMYWGKDAFDSDALTGRLGERVRRLAGSISNPMSLHDLMEKFVDCGRYAPQAPSREQLKELATQILALDELESIDTIMSQL